MLLTWCRAAPIAPAQRWPAGTPWRARVHSIAGLDLRVVDSGRGPAVVFIHGIGGLAYSWREQLGPVVAAGYRVVAFDLPGFGYSAKPRHGYGNTDFRSVVVALLDSLRLDPAVLVGHSMGGEIAAEVALAHPARVQGLVLMGPAGLGTRAPARLRVARWPIVGWMATALVGRGMVARQLRSTYADPARADDAVVDQYYAPLREPGAARAWRQTLHRFRFDSLGPHLRHIAAPTLLIWGAQDAWIPVTYGRVMAFDLPVNALIVIPDGGHNVMEEQPEAVNRALIDYLRNGLPRTPGDLALDWHTAP